MGTYVALLRGIGPTNPNMRNDKLCAALKSAGLKAVRPVLASGNLVFETRAAQTKLLERRIERALSDELGLTLDVVVRSREELAALVEEDPFDGAEHGKRYYLTVTFRKDGSDPVFTKLERAKMDGPEFMQELERRYGKRITTRTWATVHKILAKMAAGGD